MLKDKARNASLFGVMEEEHKNAAETNGRSRGENNKRPGCRMGVDADKQSHEDVMNLWREVVS